MRVISSLSLVLVSCLCWALVHQSAPLGKLILPREPWLNPDAGLVLDPFEGNEIDWEALASESRVVGIIHRATIGMRADRAYAARRAEARRRGYRWGSYHLGKRGDWRRQADFYLKQVEPTMGEVLALDIEDIGGSNMTLVDARAFLMYVKEETGRFPLVYANHAVTKEISRHYRGDSVFAATKLWYARYLPQIPNFPSGVWVRYELWQFSSEVNCEPLGGECPIRIPGTRFDMDVNVFWGSAKELRESWPL